MTEYLEQLLDLNRQKIQHYVTENLKMLVENLKKLLIEILEILEIVPDRKT